MGRGRRIQSCAAMRDRGPRKRGLGLRRTCAERCRFLGRALCYGAALLAVIVASLCMAG